MICCVVAGDVGPKVGKLVERALRTEPEVALVPERRVTERRRSRDRRRSAGAALSGELDRRRVRYADGRRVGERRAMLIPVAAPTLPRRLEQYLERLSFVEAINPPPEFREDAATVRAIIRFQSGDGTAIADLHRVWFDVVYTYLWVTRDDARADLDSQVCAVLREAVRQLPRLAFPAPRLRAWLLGIAYREACGQGPVSLACRGVRADARGDDQIGSEDDDLGWLTDDELVLFVRTRPAVERHALVLRYLGGLSFADVAEAMGIRRSEAVDLHQDALRALRRSLSAVARSPRVGGRHPMSRLRSQTPVVARRRRALLAA